nr:phage holin [uncultured Acetobacterium sp.]
MNLKIRLKNKAFWVACSALIILILQYIQSMSGMDFNVDMVEKILNALLLCAITMGVLLDPTTPSMGDSDLVMNKKEQDGRN